MTNPPRHRLPALLIAALTAFTATTTRAQTHATPATAVAQTASFTPLGDLPGGEFYSRAFGVSADGTVVVGTSRGPDPGIPFKTSTEAFRWTESSAWSDWATSTPPSSPAEQTPPPPTAPSSSAPAA